MDRFIAIFVFTFISCTGFSQRTQLDYYINNAKQSSPLLKGYLNQVQLNSLDSMLVLAAYRPQVTGNSLATYAPVIGGFGYDGAITNGGNFTALVGVNKQIPNRRTLRTQMLNLQLQSQSSINTYHITTQDLQKTIITQYITAYGDLKQLEFTNEVYDLLSKEEIVLKKLTQKNVYREVDYLAFLVTLQQQKFQAKQQSIIYRNDVATLNYLSGVLDTSIVTLEDPALSLKTLPGISNSVFFKQFEYDSLKLAVSRAIIDYNYRSKFNIFGDAGFNSSYTNFSYKNFGTSFGVSAFIPIYDGKQRRLQYRKIDIQERDRVNKRDFFLNQYNQQIAQLTQQLQETEELISDIDKQLKFTKTLIEVNAKLLQTGEARITDFVLALNTYITATNLIAQNRISRLQIINQINYWNR